MEIVVASNLMVFLWYLCSLDGVHGVYGVYSVYRVNLMMVSNL